jgi:hypothetical protein
MGTLLSLDFMLTFETKELAIILAPRYLALPIIRCELDFHIWIVSLLLSAFGLYQWALVLTVGLIIYSVVGAEKWRHHPSGNNN